VPIALAGLSFGAGANELVSLEWAADGSFAKEMTVAAGKFVEACGKLPAGVEVVWGFDAAAPMDFNIHYHVGKKLRFPATKKHVATANGILNSKVEQDYCWMWTNKTPSEAVLRFSLGRR